MKHFDIEKGLDIPISGSASNQIIDLDDISHVAITGKDYIGLKPTMEVKVGDTVTCGQLLFTDKKTPGVKYTAPGSGKIVAINRGAKRAFESLVIELGGNETVTFVTNPDQSPDTYKAEEIRETLVESGLWTAFRTRPYGKIPAIDTSPVALFITAMESEPLAPEAEIIIKDAANDYVSGLQLLTTLVDCPVHHCGKKDQDVIDPAVDGIEYHTFSGPHPAGLASTHIHFIDPVHEGKTAWQIGYQDVIHIGEMFRTGNLPTKKIIALAGAGVSEPTLIRTRVGADINELCNGRLIDEPLRIISGSVLSGRKVEDDICYLGRYHNQVSVIPDNTGRALFNWAMPGSKMFSVKPVFTSTLAKKLRLPFSTALWGGKRAIYPLGTYEDVMPLDIIPVYLLKALAVCDTEKSKDLGCMELIEEDLALCAFSCPGKNEFGPMLRDVLTEIEQGG